MENMEDREQKNILQELIQGRELAKQLLTHLNVPSSSHETREFLVTEILTSYEKAISILQRLKSVGEPQHTGGAVLRMSESTPSLAGGPRIEDSDPEHRDAPPKRKAVAGWTQRAKVSPDQLGLEESLDDGYSWRKYGQKVILGDKYPRGYYRCIHQRDQGCHARKEVQRSDEDHTVFVITYRGSHTCAQASHINPPPTSPEKQEQNKKHQPPQNQQPSQDDQIKMLLNFQTTLKVKTENLDTQGQGNVAVTSPHQDAFVPCHLFQKEEFDDIKEDKKYAPVFSSRISSKSSYADNLDDFKEDKKYTPVFSSLITTKSSYADNLDPLDLNADPPEFAKEALLQCDGIYHKEFLPEPFAEEGIEKQITSESQGMVFDVKTVEMKSSGEKIGVELEASGQDKKFEIEDIGIEPETSDIDRNTISIIQSEAHQLCLLWGGLGLIETPKEGDWKNVKEIYLMHNELSSLPENPRCPMLLALFLHGNRKLRTIPPSFFDNMPALQILNLSKTGIRSLPESIVRLVNLKRLFLSYCHRFMRLSPKVGELKQLEVLDLEGTDIMDLPKEIKELTNLTCLEVSFSAYLSNVRMAMQSDVVVPCGIISALSHLEELNMSVNPDEKRWSACVEAIVTEVCTLESLNTLKFYFPKVELVRHFLLNSPMWVHPSLSNFRFTVGYHVKRTMSRLPSDVEFELERWERCLKYINGTTVPREILEVLQYSIAFFLERHATVKKLSDFGIGNMKQLKCCVVGECNEVEVIIDATDANEEDSEADSHEEDESDAHEEDNEADAHEEDDEADAHEEDSVADAHEEDSETDAHEEDDEIEAYREDGSNGIVSKTSGAKTIVLGSLEYLYIYYMKNLRRIWKGSVQPKCLFLLKSLTLRTCPQLTTIFTTGILDNLYNLEELTVEDCPSIKTLVSCKISAKPKTSNFLPNLKRISLHYMPRLISISSGLHIAPRLEWLSFYNCPNLKHLLIEEVSSKDLKKIKGEWNWWVALKWRSGRPSYLDDIFVPINI